MGKIILAKYYKTKHWIKLRNNLLEDFDCTCEICHRRRWTLYKRATKKKQKGDRKRLLRFNVHHKHYHTLGKESRSDLLTLCQHCHNYGHMLEKAAKMNHNVFGSIYNDFCNTTAWEYEKRSKK